MPQQVPRLWEGVERTRECSERGERRGGVGERRRGEGGEGRDIRYPQLCSPHWLLVPLHFVWVELTANCYWMAGQKKSCKQPGFAHPHVQALLSEGDHCLGDRGPEKALVVQGRFGVEHNDSSRQMRTLSGLCPPDKETLNKVLEWHWWLGGRSPPPGPPGHLSSPGKGSLSPGPRAKGLGS